MSPLPRRYLQSRLCKTMRIVELGPLNRPLAPKREGWQTCIVDNRSNDELAEAYSYLKDSFQAVEQVDIVWRAGSLHESFTEADLGTFDALICSHVLEHLTDVISFLNSVSKLLRSDGTLFVLLPDKRFSFDYFRPITMTGDLFDAHRTKAINHERRTAFNQIAYSVSCGRRVSWGREPVGELTFVSNLETAMLRADLHAGPTGAPGFDYHAWCFTPTSFELIILELTHLGLIDFVIDAMVPTNNGEFCAVMKPSRPNRLSSQALERKRLALLGKTMVENALQLRLARAGGFMERRLKGLVPGRAVALCVEWIERISNALLGIFRARST